MAFVVNRREFQKVLSNIKQASRGIQYKAVMGRSSGKALTVWYDSMEGHLWQFLKNEESTTGELAFSVSIDSFLKLISAWKSKTLLLSQGDNDSLVLSSGGSTVTIPYYDDGVSLDIPSEPVGVYLGMVPDGFISDIKDSLAFIGQMSNKPELACVELKIDEERGLIINSTDSFSAYFSSYTSLKTPMASVRFNERIIRTLGTVFSKEGLQMFKMDDDSIILKGENAILQMVPIRLTYPDLVRLLFSDEKPQPIMTLNRQNTMEIIKVVEAVSKGEYIALRPSNTLDEEGGVTVGMADISMEAELKIADSQFIENDSMSYLPLDARILKRCLQVFKDDDYLNLERMDNGLIRVKRNGNTTNFTCFAPMSS